MATWKVEPTWKKSVIERNYLTKDGNTVMVETGWRWGEFTVYTDDDNPPNIEAGVDIYNCEYETELVETFDGCWEEVEYDDCDDETREWLEEFFDEGNSWLDLEEHGWTQDECEMIIDCDLEITKINDDGTEGEAITTGDNDVTPDQSIELKPGAPWPFSTPENVEETKYAEFKCVDCGYTTEDIMDLVENMDEDDKGAYLCPECGGKVDLG
jgi:DNA-directed RNA polymerase subunit RPC12/RpoP